MQSKMSPAKKKLLYALLSSSLFWHPPVVAHAAEEVAAAASPTSEQAVTDEAKTGLHEFTLTGVEVTAKRDQTLPPAYAGGQVARGGNIGVLGNKDFMDTPFSLTSYTAQTMKDQQANTVQDVLINDSSIRFGTSGGHIMENFIIRGLEVNQEFLYFNGMQGLAPLSHVPVEFLERVEVIKGPASFLYGGMNTSVGGTINLVPKRASDEDITTVTTDYTSSSHLGGHIDLGRRYGKDKELGIRFNGVYKNGNTATDGQSKERLLGALGMDYRSDKWRLSLDAYGSQETYDGGSVSMYELANGVIAAPDGSTNLLKGTYGASRNNAILFKSEYDLQDNLTAYASIGKLAYNATGSISGNHARNISLNGNATVRRYNQYWWTDAVSSELGLRGNYQTGSVKHQIVAGSTQSTAESANDSNNMFSDTVNIYDPVYHITTMPPSPVRPNKNKEQKLSSFFIGDTLSFDEEKVQLTLGLRQQKVNTKGYNPTTGVKTSEYDSSATTPVAGIVVKPWNNSVALYASYIEALSPGKTVGTGAENENEILAPYKSKQHEFGVKWDRGNFANTLAFYQIQKPSEIKVYLPAPDNAKYYVTYDGEQQNRGIEWSTFGKVADNVRLLGGVTYLRGKLVNTENGVNEGHVPFGIPKWMLNAGAEWDTPWNRDVTLSVRAIYTSSQYINNANTREIPSWIRYDAGVRYKTTIDKTPVTFYASVENICNKNYWASSFSDNYVVLGGPRTFKLSATMQL